MSAGNGRSTLLTFTKPPRRVVSLVPSMTGSMFDLQLGEFLAGVTDFCVPPETELDRLTRVGGTRAPDIAKILALRPELVMANMEENSRQTVERLEASGVRVWVTFPKTVDQAIEILWAMTSVFRRPSSGDIIRSLESTLEWTERAAKELPRRRVFCPIWYDVHQELGPWWMTFNRETYAHDLLARMGADNVFADRKRRYPLAADLGGGDEEPAADRDTRYPRVRAVEIAQAAPEIVLLPSEPFAFDQSDVARMMTVIPSAPAVVNERLHLVDGRLITWHGTHLGRALRDLPEVLMPATGV
jgi:ABC-type Fe3+-hydroxamate transport system substrate-binding protein